jgi:hypothetical protein
LTGIKSHPQLKLNTVTVVNIRGEWLRVRLDRHTRQAGTNRVVLERHRSPEHRHDAVARELVDGAAEALHNYGAAVREIGHDFAQSLRPHRRGDVHRMHDIGEQDGDLFVLRRAGRLDRCAAFATELCHRIGLRATGTTNLCRRGQSTATIPAGIHISMVSPLVNDVSHIAAPAFNSARAHAESTKEG